MHKIKKSAQILLKADYQIKYKYNQQDKLENYLRCFQIKLRGKKYFNFRYNSIF